MRGRLAALLALTMLVPAAALAQPSGQGMRLSLEAAKAQAQGNLNGAIGLYNDALADGTLTNDRRATILTDRGALYARLNQPRQAIEDLNRAVQLYPEYPAIYNNRGSALLALGLPREAIKDFDRAIVLAPGYAAAYNNRAAAFIELKQPAAAIPDFTKALELSPQALAPLNGRGRALIEAGRPQAALRDFSRAIAADARFSLGYRSRAEARMLLEQYGEAAEDLSRAIAFEPDDTEVYVLRGIAYQSARNTEAAIKDFARAIEIEPRAAQAYAWRALTHARINAAAEAEADVARALEFDPRSALGYAVRAYLAQQAGQNDVARREIDRAVKLAPEAAEVLWIKGVVEEALGRANDALQSYRAALKSKPGLRDAQEALERLGAGVASTQTEVPGLGLDPWYVVQRGVRTFAVSLEHPRISVPLEMAGEGQPRLLDWEVRRPPYRDIALLRFSTGALDTPTGKLETEHVAILDLAASTVVAVVPHREGEKRARWSWEDGSVVIEGVDGLRDELVLRQVRTAAVAPKRTDRSYAPPAWGLWGNTFGSDGSIPPPTSKGSSRPQSQRRQQPKSLFDILLGN